MDTDNPTTQTTADIIRAHYKAIGARGGRAGTGASKRRDPEHYKTLAKKRAANRELRAAFAKETIQDLLGALAVALNGLETCMLAYGAGRNPTENESRTIKAALAECERARDDHMGEVA
jgi:hypothetical protein